MSDVLCIRFRDIELSPLSSLSWVLLSPQAEVQSSGHCLLQELDQQIPPKNGPRLTTIIVPTEALLLTKISVPEAQRRHLRQTLPFMVEEQIIDPVESMHLVTPSLVVGDSQLVGCIHKDLLGNWLQLLSAVDIEPDRLVADTLCTPNEDGDWQILFDQSRVLLRQSDGVEGISLTRETVRPVLEMILNQARDVGVGSRDETDENIIEDTESIDYAELVQKRPEAIILYICRQEPLVDLQKRRAKLLEAASNTDASGASIAEFSDGNLAESHLANFSGNNHGKDSGVDIVGVENSDVENSSGEEIAAFDDLGGDLEKAAAQEIEPTDASAASRKLLAEYIRSENIDARLVDLSETATEALSITAVREQDNLLNFLQGDFTPLNANVATRKFIARVGAACAACLGLFLIVTLAGGFYLNMRADNYHADSVAIYKELFPKQRRVRDPVRQMKSQLRGGSVATTVSDFLPLLDAASKSLQQIEEKSTADTTIKQLRYDAQRGSINMELQTGNIDELESYRDLLSSEGLNVDILSANQDDNVVNGRLQIGRS